MSRRFFDAQSFAAGDIATLGEDASHHIARVLRMRAGDIVTLFNGEGGEWTGQIETVGKRGVTVLVSEFDPQDRTPPVAISIAMPIIKGERMDVAIQKATELGAAGFQLIDTERSDVRLSGDRLEKKLGHWQRVAISACEQCGMNRVPPVLAPMTLTDFLSQPRDGLTLFGQPAAQPLTEVLGQTMGAIWLVTGPEGGISAQECEALESSGALPVTLGERVLRAETAPLALLAAIQALLQ